MCETVDPGCAVGAEQDFGFAAAVFHTVERIGQRCILETGRISQYIGDSRTGEFFLIEGQLDIRQKDAFALPLNNFAGTLRAHAGALRKSLRLSNDEGLASFRDIGCEPI